MTIDRDAFEAWAATVTWGYDSEGYPLGLNTETHAGRARRLSYDWQAQARKPGPDDYWSDDTHLAWLSWLAALEHARRQYPALGQRP